MTDYNGFSSAWYQDQHRLRSGRLSGDQVAAIVERYGDVAYHELASLAGSGNYNRYVPMLGCLSKPHPADDLPLFIGGK